MTATATDAGHYASILGRLDRLRQVGRYWRARCPVHGGDRQESFALWLGGAGQLIARCWACGCAFGDVIAATGTSVADWFPPREGATTPRRVIVSDRILARYPFRDAAGVLLFEEVRLTPFPGQSKRVRYRRPMPDGMWAWSLQPGVYRHRQDGWRLEPGVVELEGSDLLLDAVPMVPYRLPELLTTPAVVVVEGPKDADTLARLGIPATASPCGARQWKPAFGAYLKGKRVAVIPDADAAGEEYAAAVLGSAVLGGAASVRLVRLPATDAVKDVTDMVRGPWKGMTTEAIKAATFGMIRAVPAWKGE